MQMKENDAKLNKTFQNSYKHQQEQIENLTKQNERLKEDIQNISNTKGNSYLLEVAISSSTMTTITLL